MFPNRIVWCPRCGMPMTKKKKDIFDKWSGGWVCEHCGFPSEHRTTFFHPMKKGVVPERLDRFMEVK